jgi:hypothetical protein
LMSVPLGLFANIISVLIIDPFYSEAYISSFILIYP